MSGKGRVGPVGMVEVNGGARRPERGAACGRRGGDFGVIA